MELKTVHVHNDSAFFTTFYKPDGTLDENVIDHFPTKILQQLSNRLSASNHADVNLLLEIKEYRDQLRPGVPDVMGFKRRFANVVDEFITVRWPEHLRNHTERRGLLVLLDRLFEIRDSDMPTNV